MSLIKLAYVTCQHAARFAYCFPPQPNNKVLKYLHLQTPTVGPKTGSKREGKKKDFPGAALWNNRIISMEHEAYICILSLIALSMKG